MAASPPGQQDIIVRGNGAASKKVTSRCLKWSPANTQRRGLFGSVWINIR